MISKNNIKYIQSLHQKKHRDEENIFVVEGAKIVSELLESSLNIRQIYATDGNWLQSYKGSLNIEVINPTQLKQISRLETPNQVLALVEKKRNKDSGDGVQVMLDGIQDPGNLGTIIRICDWFGIKDIIASKDTVDEYNPKVVQSSMGSIFRINVFYTELEVFLKSNKKKVWAAMLKGKDIKKVHDVKEGIILIGNESKGVREYLLPFIDEKIAIISRGKAESLNASVALGIILSHLV